LTVPAGYQKIHVHLVFDVKHDGWHKACLVANRCLTDVPLESVYSSIVSLRGICILVFLAELNQLELWTTDIGNAQLKATTSKKVYIIAGSEFGDQKGHVLVINKALYGLQTLGKCWHEQLANCLRDLGFQPCVAESDIWLRVNHNIYKYIVVYVDDLPIVAKDPQSITDKLSKYSKFKLKGTGPMTFHLGCDYTRNEHGVLCLSPTKYIHKVIDAYKQMFGCSPPQNLLSPLEKGDHPEMDTSKLLNQEGTERYHSLIGSLQWAVSLGCMDIATAVMTMSSFQAARKLDTWNTSITSLVMCP
jgi:Reverse transcriptase (RNA-dependent DNA polymerase)